MVSCLSIVRALQNNEVDICGFGRVVVDPATIHVGNNCIAARCRIKGTGGDMLIKCYHRSRAVEEFFNETMVYFKALPVEGFDGVTEYVDVSLSKWVDGEALDEVLCRDGYDYKLLSSSFDRMALCHLREGSVHGDIKPENIILTPQCDMQLIDFGGTPIDDRRINSRGSQLYRHRNHLLRRIDDHADDYSIALLSVYLATKALGVTDDSIFDDLEKMGQLLYEAGDMTHYNLALALQSSVTGRVDNLEEELSMYLTSKK